MLGGVLFAPWNGLEKLKGGEGLVEERGHAGTP